MHRFKIQFFHESAGSIPAFGTLYADNQQLIKFGVVWGVILLVNANYFMKVYSTLTILLFILLVQSCSKDSCTRCVETNSGIIQNLCDTNERLEEFESRLIATNVEDGIDWVCNRN